MCKCLDLRRGNLCQNQDICAWATQIRKMSMIRGDLTAGNIGRGSRMHPLTSTNSLNNLSCEGGRDHHGRLGNHDAPKDYVVNSDTTSTASMRPGTPGTVKCRGQNVVSVWPTLHTWLRACCACRFLENMRYCKGRAMYLEIEICKWVQCVPLRICSISNESLA